MIYRLVLYQSIVNDTSASIVSQFWKLCNGHKSAPEPTKNKGSFNRKYKWRPTLILDDFVLPSMLHPTTEPFSNIKL